MSPKFCLCIGALVGAVGVSLGALGAHGLKTHLNRSLDTLHEQSLEYAQTAKEIDGRLKNWDTAARYQMIHALALLAVGLIKVRGGGRSLSLAAWAFVAGVVMFSGGLYGYVLTEIKPLVSIVPIGGVMFIAGWLALAVGAWGGAMDQRQ